MQIACAQCSLLRVMRVLHPADPPSWRNQGSSHELSKLGVAGSSPVTIVDLTEHERKVLEDAAQYKLAMGKSAHRGGDHGQAT